MSEDIEPIQPSQPIKKDDTQPLKPIKEDDTQPIRPIKKTPRWRSILIGALAFILLVGLGGFSGFRAGIGDRESAQEGVISGQLAEQYKYALVDIQFGHFDAAKQRLLFIIGHQSNYPGAQDLLTQVLVLSVIPTFTPTPTLTSTPDLSGAENSYLHAQQLIAAGDWPGALGALDTIRKLDPSYKTAQVDGMYYFALRNYGHDLITKEGNLEGGIYQLTLAERFGPLDSTANGLREGARMYVTGASFWELDWSQAVAYFAQVNSGWPALWDGTMNATQRFYNASVSYGDELYGRQQFCDAYTQYQNAAAVGQLDATAAGHSNQAFLQCFPATPTTGVVIVPTSTTAAGPTNTTAPAVPTDTPVPAPPTDTSEPPTDIPTDTPIPP